MRLNTRRGFTLIELLVVIAIIGILASVVLASLNSARAKGADAAIKSSINNARAQAELVYDNNGSTYQDVVCDDPTILNIENAVNNAGGTFVCDDEVASGPTAYRISSVLVSDPTLAYCVDSTGVATTTAAGGISDEACP